jgi:4-hydroxybenzoate polyprenyltransferase
MHRALYFRHMLQLKKIFKGFADFIIYGNFFIATCALMSMLSTVVLFNSFVDENDIKLYNIHKLISFRLNKQLIDNQRFSRVKSFQIPLSILTILAGIYCLYFFLELTTNAKILLIGLAALSLGYVLPILGNGRRLRDIAHLKIFVIALVWAATTIALPFLDLKNATSNICFWLLFIERTCFIFALCISFDIRDMDLDSQTNVKTIPLSMGAENAKICAISALIVALILVLLLRNNAMYNSALSLKLAIIYLLAGFLILKTHKNRTDYFFYGLIDGLILIQSLVIIIYN